MTISQGLSEAENGKKRQTIQWPKEKGQTMIYKTSHRKQKIEKHESHNTGGELRCSGE
jgi:hypothetical protein